MRQTQPLFMLLLCLSGVVQAMKIEPDKAPTPARIGILFWLDSANELKTYLGIKEGLAATGLPIKLDKVEAKGDEKLAIAALQRWQQKKFDLIITMGTRMTLLAKSRVKKLPIVFAAVTTPPSAGLPLPGECHPQGNITGASNWIFPRFLLREFKAAMPGLKRLGVIYNPQDMIATAEVNSATLFLNALNPDQAEPWVKELRNTLKLIPIKVRKGTDVKHAAARLASTCDAIWIPFDNLVHNHLDQVTTATRPLAKPLFTSTRKSISHAVIGVTVDFRLLGLKAAATVLKIIEGHKPPGRIPVTAMRSHHVIINLVAARRIGLQIPLPVLCSAEEIIDDQEKK